MVRTRVGYAGGRTPHPTYHDLGEHSESVQIDYDPGKILYEQLLAVFWATHNPCAQPGSRQYMSAIFYHNEAQKKAALATRAREEGKRGRSVITEILPADTFTAAEDYHQKYLLREESGLMREFRAMYPDDRALMNSTAAARVNGYLGGHGSEDMLRADLPRLGLTPDGRERLLRLWRQAH